MKELSITEYEKLNDYQKSFYEPKGTTTCNRSTNWERKTVLTKYKLKSNLTISQIADLQVSDIQYLGYRFTLSDVKSIAKNFFMHGASYDFEN